MRLAILSLFPWFSVAGWAEAQTAAAGKIAFSSTRADLNTDVYLMNLDGTGIQRLTYDPGEDVHPALSPDGTKVAFVSTRGLTIPTGQPGSLSLAEIYVVNVDGTGLTKLTSTGAIANYPTWSPDGTQIAYVVGPQSSASYVYKVSATGGTPIRLAEASPDSPLVWSHTPGGDFIYYNGRSVVSGGYDRSYPYRMNVDGTNVQPQNQGPRIYSPDGAKYLSFNELYSATIFRASDDTQIGAFGLWSYSLPMSFSADSQKVVFAGYFSDDTTHNKHIYSINLNGTGLTDLTLTEGAEDSPTCGPGMVQTIPEPPTGFGKLLLEKTDGLYVMNPEGWGLQKLNPSGPGIHPAGALHNPKWSRDGTRIAADDGRNLFTMAADGTDLRQVTAFTTEFGVQPTWNYEGTALAYQYQDGSPYYYHERIHNINLDGTNDVVVSVGSKTFEQPAWQPVANSARLAYFEGAAYLESTISVADVNQHSSAGYFTNSNGDGSYNAALTFGFPTWNVTGTRLTVVRNEQREILVNGQGVYQFVSNLVSVASDGTGLVNLTANQFSNDPLRPIYSSPTYSPDGEQVGYLDKGGLTLLRLDGTSEKRLFAVGFNRVDWGNNFNYAEDTQAPVVAITPVADPVTRKLLVLAGTIDDTAPFAAGPALVRLQLQRLSDGKYWDPSSTGADPWINQPSPIAAALGALDPSTPARRTWRAMANDLPPASAMSSGNYRVTAKGIDNRGTVSSAVSSDFTIYQPGQLAFSASSYTVNEATNVSTPGPVVVQRIGGSDGTVTVAYATKNTGTTPGSATDGVDFILPSGTLTFAPGETSKALPLQLLDDDLLEQNESFSIELSNPTGGADFGEASYQTDPINSYVTIEDDEVAKTGHIEFAAGVAFVREDAGTADIVIRRTGGSIPVDLSFSTSGGGGGFTHVTDASQTVHFDAADVAKTVSMPLINDSAAHPDERVYLTLITPSGYLGGLLIIRDKDFLRPAGTFAFGASAYTTDDKGNGVDVTVKRTGSSVGGISTSVQPDFSYGPGTAIAGTDFILSSNYQYFGDGDTTPEILHIPIPSGVAASGAKTINLLLYDQDYNIVDHTTVTIQHDPNAPGAFQVASVTATATEGETITVTVNRTGGNSGAATVPFSFLGTAIKGKDFSVDAVSPLHFADGQTSQSVHITTSTDQVADPDETIIFALSEPSRGTLGSAAAETITVADGPSGSTALNVATAGSGHLSAGFLGTSSRVIGKTYTVTATPADGSLFLGWSGGETSSKPRLTFTMRAGLSLTATFVPNPFLLVSGKYLGLASPTQSQTDPAMVSLNIADQGGFTGSIFYPQAIRALLPILGSKLPFKGTFDPLGHYHRDTSVGPLALVIDLQHSPANGGSVSGTVSIGTAIFHVAAKRVGYSAKHPAPMAGTYTVALAPSSTNTSSPRGHGLATVTITTNGKVRAEGTLADGTPFVASAPLTGTADFTIFEPLYASAGQLTGTWTVTPSADIAAGDIAGDLQWIRPAGVKTGKLRPYPAGFATALTSLGSAYSKPQSGNNVYAQPQTAIVVDTTGSQTSSPVVHHSATMDGKSKVSSAGTDQITGSFTEASGLFNGTFTAAGQPQVKTCGVFLQKQGLAFGFYLENGASGDFALRKP